MTMIDDITDHILPDEDRPGTMRKWRMRVALTACSNWIYTFLILTPFLIMALFTDTVPKLSGVVWAAEINNKIEKSVETAVQPIRQEVLEVKQEVSGVKEAVEALTEANRASAAAALGNTIIQATRERCKTMSQGRGGEAWADRIFELRRQYRKLTGETFDPLTCTDV